MGQNASSMFWLIPVLPLVAAGVLAVAPRRSRGLAVALAVGSLALALFLSVWALAATLTGGAGGAARQTWNFPWLQIGGDWLRLGLLLDPLSGVMLVMVSLVSLLIFIYSAGYMAEDWNFTRFFCFLSLFASAMLGLVMANSLLLLFACWELVGLTSYLLIGFWYEKPSAAAAAKKAFLTTRIGDLGLFLGMLWLFSEAGTLLFYDQGGGCLESDALTRLAARTTVLGLALSTAIGLLIFCGAIGKSGQLPLHVWLPDAMEGPTPVSALIHAATMVAAGVFLVARLYPLMGLVPAGGGFAPVLAAVTWIGALTAVFAALIAVAQNDIKRILAYSTISQLGYMMIGLGAGGVAVGMFHLITHAFFKALLFLGAGSVIHGCAGEQDIRRLGGLRRFQPITFATYAIGMMSLAGLPLFAGFWSKDEILHAAQGWPLSRGPFYLGLLGAALTAFYMTRQVCLVFFGQFRGGPAPPGQSAKKGIHDAASEPHESPAVMTAPLIALAGLAILAGFIGTPAWPWLQGYLTGKAVTFDVSRLFESHLLAVMGISTVLVALGILLAWRWYGGARGQAFDPDPLEVRQPALFGVLQNRFYVDEFYAATVVAGCRAWGRASDWIDRQIWETVALAIRYLVAAVAWISRFADEYLFNLGFDRGCDQLSRGGTLLSRLQDGQVQNYLRVIGLALALFLLLLTWGCQGGRP